MNSFISSLFSGAPVQLQIFWRSVVIAWDAVWWIVLPVILAIMFWEFWRMYLHYRFFKAINFKLLEIKVPKNILKTPKAMEQIFAAAHAPYSYGIRPFDKYIQGKEEYWMSFELIGHAGESHFYLRVPGQHQHMMESAIYAQYPDAEIVEAEEYMHQFPKILPNHEFDISGFEEVLRHESYLPIRTYPEFEEAVEEQRLDSIAPIMETMSRLKDDEHLWYQVIVKPTGEAFKKEGEEWIAKKFNPEEKKKPKGIFAGAGLGVSVGEIIQSPFKHPGQEVKKESPQPKAMRLMLSPSEKEATEGVARKISKIAFEATLRFLYINRRGQPDAGFMNTVHGFIRQFNTQDMNSLRPYSKTTTASYAVRGLFKKARLRWRKRLMWESYEHISPSHHHESILNVEELATLYHFPITAVSTTELEKIASRKGSPPSSLPMIDE